MGIVGVVLFSIKDREMFAKLRRNIVYVFDIQKMSLDELFKLR